MNRAFFEQELLHRSVYPNPAVAVKLQGVSWGATRPCHLRDFRFERERPIARR